MTNPSGAILIFTSNMNNSIVAADVLREYGMVSHACRDSAELLKLAAQDCGVIVISEDSLDESEIFSFHNVLESQETWSDTPVILLTSKSVAHATELYSKSGNISYLETPFSRYTLVRACEVALRARNKQYQVRDLLVALNQSKEDAEKANIAKTEFLANMSHEIRSPIGAILGFLDLMKDPKNKPGESETYMGIVERNSQQLLRLIDDILDLSKVEAGKMTIEQVPFSLGDLLDDLNSIMAFKAQEKGIAFQSSIETPLPDQICSDPVRLRQILGNIIGNAIKFTSKGYVRLQVEYKDSFVHFTVKDTGVGISDSQLKKLFQPFSQADTSTTRKFGGTGLGLILSKRLAESLGGELHLVESEINKGSTFSISIKPTPVAGSKMISNEISEQTQKPFVQNTANLNTLKVLVVEDSPDNQTLILTLLKMAGAKVDLASDGQEGIEKALKEDYDVVLMDVQMPIMDGHVATRTLRSQNYKKPIVALTAHAMEEERRKCFESGYSEFLTKPIRRDHLINLLSQYLKK